MFVWQVGRSNKVRLSNNRLPRTGSGPPLFLASAPIYDLERRVREMTHSDHDHPTSDKPVILAIAAIAIVYAVLTATGQTASQHGGGDHAADRATAHDTDAAPTEHEPRNEHAQDHHADDEHGDDEHGDAAGHAGHGTMPDRYAVIPFVLLLGAIALLPLISATEHWWESNRNRFLVAVVLAGVTLLYYLFLYTDASLDKVLLVLDHAILQEYIPFIVLLFSLYTISGGIRIEGDLRAHPATNTTFIAVGGLLASFIGTTGAAMLLIRPLLETNKERKHVQHTVIFFIFVVCNCGGCLLPIGDPPLFLGYLEGVDFLWTMWALWKPWLAVNAALIAIYFCWDLFFCYPRETTADLRADVTQTRALRITGLWPNALLLLGVVLSVALLDPKKVVPGTDWHPWVYLREVVQLALVALSLLLGCKKARAGNKFNYHAIVEVAALFVGIFICMQPALEILGVKGPNLGIDSPMKFFWVTGILSAVLDNAPTYLVFFRTADAQFPAGPLATLLDVNAEANAKLIGISLGAVFMGSMTYIGNGPNFMVRAIAEQSGVKMPSFIGYFVRYSVPILIPVLVVATLVFL